MPGDVIEIAPEPDSRLRPKVAPFANQYAAILAEHALQNNELAQQRRSPRFSTWLALAFASGAVIALAFVYFLAQ